MDERFIRAHEEAERLLAENREHSGALARETEKLRELLVEFQREEAAFEAQLARLLDLRGPVTREAIAIAVEQRVASGDGNVQARIRTVVQELGQSYQTFMQLMEDHMGERDEGSRLIRSVLAQLLGPVARANVQPRRPLARTSPDRARPRAGTA